MFIKESCNLQNKQKRSGRDVLLLKLDCIGRKLHQVERERSVQGCYPIVMKFRMFHEQTRPGKQKKTSLVPMQPISNVTSLERVILEKLRVFLWAICIAIFLCMTSCENLFDSQPISTRTSPPRLLTVNVIEAVRSENRTETIVVYGKITPRQQSRPTFERGGKVEFVAKAAGEKVTQGDVLASLEQTEIEEQRDQIVRSLEEARKNLDSTRNEVVTAAQQQIAQLEKQLASLEEELRNGVIVASFDGVVDKVFIQAGSLVSPTIETFLIVDDGAPIVEANLAAKTASLLGVEQEISGRFSDRTLKLKFGEREELRGPIEGEKIRFELVEKIADEDWEYGDVVEVRIVNETEQSGFRVPLSALHSDTTGEWSIYVAEPVADSSAETHIVNRRSVELVEIQGDVALVEGSLATGELIISAGTHRIVTDQQIVPDIRSENEAATSQGATG